jgi:hypothetical protein
VERGEAVTLAEDNKALIQRYFEEVDAAAQDGRGASVLD